MAQPPPLPPNRSNPGPPVLADHDIRDLLVMTPAVLKMTDEWNTAYKLWLQARQAVVSSAPSASGGAPNAKGERNLSLPPIPLPATQPAYHPWRTPTCPMPTTNAPGASIEEGATEALRRLQEWDAHRSPPLGFHPYERVSAPTTSPTTSPANTIDDSSYPRTSLL